MSGSRWKSTPEGRAARRQEPWSGRAYPAGGRMPAESVRRLTLSVPALLIVIGVVLNISTEHEFTGAPFFTAAPLVAAPFTTPRMTALTGAVALAVLAALRVVDTTSSGLEDAVRTVNVAVVALLAIGLSRLLQRRGAAIASFRGIAEAAQYAVLPVPPSRLGDLHVAARYRAAQADARIGGDLYAVQDTPYGTRLLVGDVRGKGMDAIETVVIVIGAFREAAEQEPTLEAVAGRLDRALEREDQRRRGLDSYEGFTTAAIAELPAADPGTLRVVNRGHPPPLLLADGHVRALDPSVPALPLGMTELNGWADRVDEAPFPPGTQLLLYTDGLSESRDRSGAFFDPAKALSGRTFGDPEELLDAVLAGVRAHEGGGSTDDMALLAVERM